MKQVEVGETLRDEALPGEADLASAIGNKGVDVVSSPATIGYLEIACHKLLASRFEDDEASVGTGFRMRHLAPAFLGRPVDLHVELIAHQGSQYTFKVKAEQAGKLIMDGEHDRAVIKLSRFLRTRAAAE